METQSIVNYHEFFFVKEKLHPWIKLFFNRGYKIFLLILLVNSFVPNSFAQCNMAQPGNQTLIAGSATSAVNFTGATSYSWTNDNPAIGLAASGSGNIGSFTATNNTALPITATITVTPTTTGLSSAYIPTVTSNLVNVINTITNTVSTSIGVSNYPIGVSVSPDGSRAYIANTGAGNVTVINTSTNAIITTISGFNSPYSLAVSPDGTKLYVANQTGGDVTVVNTASNTISGSITGMNGPNAIAFTPDGTKAYVTNNFNGTVAVVNTTTNTIITTIPGFSAPVGISMSPDGTKAYVANQNAGNVAVINTTTNTISTNIGVTGNPFGVCVSPDGNLVYSANINSNQISKINATTNTLITSINVGTYPQGVQVSADNSKVYVACDASNSLYVINTSTDAVITTIGTGSGPKALGNFLTPGNCTGSPVTFTITVNPSLSISSISPTNGTVGTLVTITGTNLNNPTALSIGGVAAIPVSNDGTTLVAMVMPGATTGLATITNGLGSASSATAFTVTPNLLPISQQGSKLTPTGNVGNPQFGRSVAISADGNTAAVGGWLDNSNAGAVWIFVRSGGVWTQQGSKLVGTGGCSSCRQGMFVAISADGNTVLSGEYQDVTQEVFVFKRTGITWSQEARLPNPGGERFGSGLSLSADGNTASIGGFYAFSNQGRAWVYTRSAGIWTLQATLSPSSYSPGGPFGGPLFGTSTALSADGNTLAVGALADDNLTANFIGAIYAFKRTGVTWSLQGKIAPSGTPFISNCGNSIAISADGNTIAAGAPQTNNPQGATFVITRSGSTWSHQAALIGTGLPGFAAQGISVGLSADGNTLMVGGPNQSSTNGALWLFTRAGSTWTQSGTVVGTGNSGAANQGYSLSVASDGRTMIQSGFSDNSNLGAAWIFIPPVAPTITSFTPSSGCSNSGTVVITGTSFTGASSVSVGGTPVSSFTVNSATQITATIGAGTTGTITVNGAGGTATSAGTYTVNAAPISTITPGGPTTFACGSSVTLSGPPSTINKGLQFGSGRFLFTNGNVSHGTNFTYETWVKVNSPQDWAGILTSRTFGQDNNLFQMSVTADGRFKVEVKGAAGGPSVKIYEGTTNIVGAWHHVAFTYDGNNLILYVDGNTEPIIPVSNVAVGPVTINRPLLFAAERELALFLNCELDEARVWNVVRTQSEISTNKNVYISASTPNLIAYYRMDEGTGLFSSDLTTNANHANHANGPIWINPSTPLTNYNTYTYLWSPGGATTQSITANNSNTYSVTVTGSNGCTSSSSQVVTVGPVPTASVGGNVTMCSNSSHTVTGASAANGARLWTHNGLGQFADDGTGNPGATSTLLLPTYTASPGDAGNSVTLTLTVSAAPCASAIASFSINVIATPTASAGGSAVSCENGSVTVSGATASNYSSVGWTHNGNGFLTNANTLTPTYTCDAADAGSTVTLTLIAFGNSPCSNASAIYTINVSPRPTVSLTLGPNTICNNVNGVVRKLTVSNIEANTTYLWSPATDLYTDAAYTIPYTNQNVTEVWAVPFVTTSYSVTATNNTSLCTTPASIPVTLNVCSNLANDICGAALMPVTTTGTFTNLTLLGATASAGVPCALVERDVFRKVIVPSTGELHITTSPGLNANPSLNIQRSILSILYGGNTCTTSPQVACNSTGAAGNQSYVFYSGMTPGDTAWIRIGKSKEFITDPNTPSQFILINIAPALTWTGSANTAFMNPSNWLGGDATTVTVPSSTKSVLIRQTTNVPVVSSNEQIRTLTMNTGAGLTVNSGNTLSISNRVQTANNTIGGSGFVVLNGTAAQPLAFPARFNYLRVNNSAGVNVTAAVRVGGLDLQQGVVTTNNNLTLLSDGGLTGYLNNFTTGYTGSLSGNLNVERRVVLGSTSNASPDHYLASPVAMTGNVTSNYNDDFSVVGSPAGYVFNSNPAVAQPSVFPSTWTYDETQTIATIPGWIGAGATTLAPGQGFSARVTATRVVDILGIPNNAGVNRAVTLTDDGLNLIGNPYPSSINFSSFASANASTILPVLYIWNPANSSYASFAAGLWTNNPAGTGASDVIGHSQSFFVFATQSGNVSFSNSMRTVNQAANFFAAPEGLIRLEVSSNGQTDEAVVATNTEATENYDQQVDAKKLLNALTPSILAFTLSADNTPLAINAMDKFSTEQVIPVQIIATTAGEVNIKLNMADLKGRFDHIYLEDATFGTYTDLKARESYSATVSQGNSGSRFFLHFAKPSIASVTNELGVYAANSSVFANLPSESNGTIEVVDLVGKTIYTSNFSGKSGRVEFLIPNAVYGSYIVKLTSNGKVSNKKIVLSE
jgi:YVTN family beta-propeller protein